MPCTELVHNRPRKGLEVGASTACQNENTAGPDENLFRQVPVPGHSARVLPLKLVLVPGHDAQVFAQAQQKAIFRPVAIPSAPCLGDPSLERPDKLSDP